MLREDLKGAGYKDNCGITNAEIKQTKNTVFGNYPKHILLLGSLKFFLMAKFPLGHNVVKRNTSFKKENINPNL